MFSRSRQILKAKPIPLFSESRQVAFLLEKKQIKLIKVLQADASEVLKNRQAKISNFEHVNLPPNHPAAIVDRALFKVGVFINLLIFAFGLTVSFFR